MCAICTPGFARCLEQANVCMAAVLKCGRILMNAANLVLLHRTNHFFTTLAAWPPVAKGLRFVGSQQYIDLSIYPSTVNEVLHMYSIMSVLDIIARDDLWLTKHKYGKGFCGEGGAVGGLGREACRVM